MTRFPEGPPPAASRPTKIDDLIDGRLMARLDHLDVVSRKIFNGRVQGERRSKRRGQSVEFADFRPYVHGDDLRFVGNRGPANDLRQLATICIGNGDFQKEPIKLRLR